LFDEIGNCIEVRVVNVAVGSVTYIGRLQIKRFAKIEYKSIRNIFKLENFKKETV